MSISRTILVVDDEEQVLYVWRCALQKLNGRLRIETAQSGPEALDILAKRKIDLVITDFRMPDMNGDELTQLIRSREPGMKIIWITAYRTPAIDARARELSVPLCLDKPISVKQIRRMMEKELALTQDVPPDL